LEETLASVRSSFRHVLIAIEGLYSMDGDVPDLARVVDIKKRFGAWLLLDEAHSIGVLGATGRGVREAQNIPAEDIDILMGTLSKSFCSCGGFVSGRRTLTDVLRYDAPGFVFSVGLPAPTAAAARACLKQLRAEPARVAALQERGHFFAETARALGLDLGLSQGHAVAPVMIGDSLSATRVSNALLADGFNVLPIIAPAVENRAARLRFFLNADHDPADIEAAVKATARRIDEAMQTFSDKGPP
jgi:7-keto-8-aminopelargonate synthetase-like enzyme